MPSRVWITRWSNLPPTNYYKRLIFYKIFQVARAQLPRDDGILKLNLAIRHYFRAKQHE